MKHFTAIILLCLSALSIQAQNEVQIGDIEMINLGDGRLFARDGTTKNDKPIDGRIRIINGYTTEYIDAGFDKGYADGKWEYYKYNNLSEVKNYSKGYVNGEEISYYGDGKTIKSKATIKNGKADGIIYNYSQNGKVEYEKGMKDGFDEGFERRYDENGKVIAETNFINGKAEGKSFAVYNKGFPDEYTITRYYKNSQSDGDYSEIFANGNVQEKGQYVNGKKDGTWEYGKKDGKKISTEVYSNDDKIKETKYYNDNTVEVVRELKNGEKNGWERTYNFGTGKLKSEVFYKDGEVSSETSSGGLMKQTKQITSNLGIYVRTFYEVNGNYEGEYTEQWQEGAKGMKAKGQYKDGKKAGQWIYEDQYGKKEKEENYLNGELDGAVIIYSCENGKPSKVYEYSKGELNGAYKEYWCNTGNLMVTGTYVDGRVKGIRKHYDSDGKVTDEENIQ